MKTLLAGLAGLALPLWAARAADKPEAPTAPPPTITLYDRHGHVTPQREGFQHTGGGNIDVAQPAPDTVAITMTGVAVAGPHPCKPSVAAMDFDLEQSFEIGLDKPGERKLKLTVEARVIGLLRGPKKGCGVAEESGGQVTVLSGPAELVSLAGPAHSVGNGDNLSINDRCGPLSAAVTPGKYTLRQLFRVAVHHEKGLCGKASSAEFAPDPALDPLWISYFEPFHGAVKKDFGFQVTLKVVAE
jgi:hypothetical protein